MIPKPRKIAKLENPGYVRKIVTNTIMLLALGGLGVLGWFAVQDQRYGSDGELPIFKNDPTPYKIAPSDPGGMDIPNQDKQVFNVLAGNNANEKGEHNITILPVPEAPIARTELTSEPEKPIITPVILAETPLEEDSPEPTEEEALPPGTSAEIITPTAKPATVELAQTPEGEPATQDDLPALPDLSSLENMPAELPAEGTSSSIKTATIMQSTDSTPDTITITTETARGVQQKKLPFGEIPSKPRAPDTTSAVPRAVSMEKPEAGIPSGWHVQLGSYRSVKTLQSGWQTLSRKYPDILRGLNHHMKTVNLGLQGIFYRLHAGPFLSRDSAQKLCQKLVAKRQGCLVTKL